MESGLMPAGAAGLDEAGELNALVTMLALTSDAVLAFDTQGTVVLANDEADRIFRSAGTELVGSDVRSLFPPAQDPDGPRGSLEDTLPFGTDGSACDVVCEGRHRARMRLRVRCERVAGGYAVWLLVARELVDAGKEADDESQRLVDELSRANRRLAGTLDIVLGTLDSLDLGTLFSRVLVDITRTMDAWASLAYMAERDGYRLRGSTESLGDVAVPMLMALDDPVAERASRGGRTLRIRVLSLSRDELREGSATTRRVFDETTQSVLEVAADALPPFANYMVAPVSFGGHTIALVVVGWRHARKMHKDDATLLDAVTEYLSVQLAGAIAAYRSQRSSDLERLGSLLRERLITTTTMTSEVLDEVFADAAEGLGAALVPMDGNPHQRTTMARLPHVGLHYVPFDLFAAYRAGRDGDVIPLDEDASLCSWLRDHAESCNGVLVLPGVLEDAYRGYMVVRDEGDEPLDDAELAFLAQLCSDACEVEKGERLRNRDKRISQALQHGMRNELQHVEGLTAQSRYSSATEAAYVGGDFYDLIRLPERRACVIMGDVSGKGVEAASVSSAVKTALGAYAWEGIAPSRMVALLNDFLLGFSRLETFATLFVGIVDLRQRTLAYCSAGHPPALLVRADGGGELVSLGVQSGVVGAFSTTRYRDGQVDLREGDVLVLYTDGVTEARNPEGDFFDEDGLRETVSREMGAGFEGLCDRVLQSVADFAGGRLEDDVALVALRVDALPG